VDHLDRLAADPYQAGWLVKVKLSGDAGLSALMDYAAYQKQCEEETESH
jgi:glycine cleavage system H protein